MSDAPSSPGNSTTIPSDAIEIVVPLRVAHAATLRVVVASLGSDHGLSIDEIDDLKLAVSEVFTVLVDDADGLRSDDSTPRARARYLVDGDTIVVTLGDADAEIDDGTDADADLELDALATTILSSVVDEHRVEGRTVTLVKRRGETAERGAEILR